MFHAMMAAAAGKGGGKGAPAGMQGPKWIMKRDAQGWQKVEAKMNFLHW